MPSDAQRISYVKHLVDQGYEDKIVIAQDLHFKHRMVGPYQIINTILWYKF